MSIIHNGDIVLIDGAGTSKMKLTLCNFMHNKRLSIIGYNVRPHIQCVHPNSTIMEFINPYHAHPITTHKPFNVSYPTDVDIKLHNIHFRNGYISASNVRISITNCTFQYSSFLQITNSFVLGRRINVVLGNEGGTIDFENVTFSNDSSNKTFGGITFANNQMNVGPHTSTLKTLENYEFNIFWFTVQFRDSFASPS